MASYDTFLRSCAIVAATLAVGCVAPPTDDETIEALDPDDEVETEPEDEPDDAEQPSEPSEPAAEPLPPRAGALHGTCPTDDAGAGCHEGGQAGIQFCDQGQWGACLMETECAPGDVQVTDCPVFGPTELQCMLDGGIPAWEDCGFTPLVLSFDGREPTFDAGTQAFELSDGSNACLARQWPGAQTPWLAIDLDGSGAIENGGELFGSATPTADGHRPKDGFEALAQFDDDGDGRITKHDEVWTALLLWSDHDRDRVSSGWELLPVEHSGLTAIELGHTVERRCDDGGNCGIERSHFAFMGHDQASRTGAVIDVHIPCD